MELRRDKEMMNTRSFAHKDDNGKRRLHEPIEVVKKVRLLRDEHGKPGR